jgi:hypothetical protein
LRRKIYEIKGNVSFEVRTQITTTTMLNLPFSMASVNILHLFLPLIATLTMLQHPLILHNHILSLLYPRRLLLWT